MNPHNQTWQSLTCSNKFHQKYTDKSNHEKNLEKVRKTQTEYSKSKKIVKRIFEKSEVFDNIQTDLSKSQKYTN